MAGSFCSRCGSSNASGAQFCPKCGSPVGVVAPPPSPYQPIYGTPPPQQQFFVSPAPSPPPMSKSTAIGVAVFVVVVVVVLVAALIVGLWVLSASSSAPSSGGGGNNLPPPVTVATSGTVWPLSAGQYEYLGPVSLSTGASSWSTSGSFTASNGITAYILTSSQFQSYSGGTPSSYYWTSGQASSGSVNANGLPPGTYYFVWDNTNLIYSSSVQITANIVCSPS